MEGSRISRADLRGARILLVRTVTSVGAELLAGTEIEFVGSPTAGIDHVDLEWLSANRIAFAHAPGANARAVAEWVALALVHFQSSRALAVAGSTLGVVGLGNVGSRVARYGRALGMRVLASDPPLERAGRSGPFVSLERLLVEADFLTLHVPLAESGPDRTRGLVGARELGALKRSAVLINSSRGPVVDGSALKEALGSGQIAGAALDVYENEPDVDRDLLALVEFATPHIAGYSVESKAAATLAVYREARSRFGWPDLELAELLPSVARPRLSFQPTDPGAALEASGLAELARRFRADPSSFHHLRRIAMERRELDWDAPAGD